MQVDQLMLKPYREEQRDRGTGKGLPASTKSTWSCRHYPSSTRILERAAHDRRERPLEDRLIPAVALEEANRTLLLLLQQVDLVLNRGPGQVAEASLEVA